MLSIENEEASVHKDFKFYSEIKTGNLKQGQSTHWSKRAEKENEIFVF